MRNVVRKVREKKKEMLIIRCKATNKTTRFQESLQWWKLNNMNNRFPPTCKDVAFWYTWDVCQKNVYFLLVY